MDPVACYEMLCDALEHEDYEVAEECAGNLIDWVKRGGFVPEEINVLSLLDLIKSSAHFHWERLRWSARD